ncbi:apolipoprotein acyltransferase [Mesorhizobium tianshanense]|uniref:Putative amidohydrolase n=1 Tax=Mesorhizobium tianshanense TaxID=39844 RepID=A0A562MBG2_9HYPH|nr:carbon-nitrogen hydrolase family protein [Mesorhizobium tianshanense]TWI17275.1 putative amidohydrolase [Mesorhizobium tianshanense]GLS35557.1 apolipoprotein acyltransferase [Mesorhizobium tianshanense]
MKSKLTIALAQLAPEVGNTETNLTRAIEAADKAKAAGADILMLPELHLQGYRADELFAELAETIPGPSTDRLGEVAKKHNLHIVMGMGRRSEGFPDLCYNSLCFLGPEGVIGWYDKIHLGTFHPYIEGVYFAPGRSAPVFDTRFGKVALQICYDASFPELTRLYAMRGAVLNLVISAGPSGDCEGWANTLRQRASENVMWTAYCNTVGKQKDFSFFGGSKIVNPFGQIVAEAKFDEEDFLVATIDLEQSFHTRRHWMTFRDVQPWLLSELAEASANAR